MLVVSLTSDSSDAPLSTPGTVAPWSVHSEKAAVDLNASSSACP